MNDRRPPIRPRVALLPFDDPQQSWNWFEEAVRDLLGRMPQFRNVEAYGVQGDHQEGIDIRADSEAGHIGIQCKKVTECGPGDVGTAILAATYPAERFILALSRRATVGARRVIDQHENWELWDQARLSDAVRALPPDQAVDYIERHFHLAWVNDFLGRGRPSTFIGCDASLEPFRDVARLVHHEWTRVDDNGALLHLQAFLASRERVALVDGPIGIGKSKLVYDLTAADLGRPVYFLAAGATVTPDGLREISAGPALIIVDNADDAEGVSLLLGQVLRNPDQQLILTVSASAVAAMNEHLTEAGLEPAQLRSVSLERLARRPTIELAREALGREDAEIEEAIVLHASDSPLTTILTAKLIRDRTTTTAALESEGHVRDLVRSLYREVATGAVADEIPREDVKAVLQLLAAVGPARIERDDWLMPAASFLAWDVEHLLRVIDAIDDARILSRLGSKYAVAPEMLRQSIMLEACTVRGRRTTFPNRVLEHFPQDPKLLHNLAIADLESRASGGPDLFSAPWESIAQAIRDGNSLDRSHFLSQLDTLGFFKPDEVFELVAFLVDHPATNEDTQPYADVGIVIEHKSVLREMPGALKRVMMGSRERLSGCVELLWRIGKDQTTWHSGDDPIRTVSGLVRYEVGVGTEIAAAVVDVVARMIERGERDTKAHSLLELIAPVLARDVQSAISQGTQLTIRRFVLTVDSVRDLRDRALGVVGAAALGASPRRADKAIGLLADLLREPANQLGEPSVETVAAWDRERGLGLDVFDQIVDAGTLPIRELRIAHNLPFYARYSPSAYVRERASALLGRLGSSPGRDRYRVLMDEFLRADTFVDLRRERDWQEGERRRAAFVSTVAAEVLAATDVPDAIVADLRTRMAAIADAGLYASPRLLFAEIHRQRPDLGMSLVDAILETGDPGLYSWLEPFIRAEFLRDPAQGEALARRVMAIGHADASIAVANALVYHSERADHDCAIRQGLFQTLLTSAFIEARRAAAHDLMFLKNECPDVIPELVLHAEIGADSALAERLYLALPANVEGIDVATRDALAAKLVPVLELDHWPLAFLQHMAPTRSAVVLDVFAARIFLDGAPEGYASVPSSEISVGPVVRALATSPTFEAELLALIRQRADIADEQLARFAPFLRHIAHVLPDLVKGMVVEGLASQSEGIQRAALTWVRYVPHAVLEGDVPYIIRMLERAHEISAEMGMRAEGAITAELTTGAESVGHYEGAPSDMRLQTVAKAALPLEGLSIPVRRFFAGLLEHGRRLEQQTIHSAEEAFGPQ